MTFDKQDMWKIFIFLVMKFRPPPPLQQSFLPNNYKLFEYPNIYLSKRHPAINLVGERGATVPEALRRCSGRLKIRRTTPKPS